MTKADIIERIVAGNGFARKESQAHVEALFELITDTLADGETLKISGFGSFIVKEKNKLV